MKTLNALTLAIETLVLDADELRKTNSVRAGKLLKAADRLQNLLDALQ
jgi:hypothetical protein